MQIVIEKPNVEIMQMSNGDKIFRITDMASPGMTVIFGVPEKGAKDISLALQTGLVVASNLPPILKT